MLTPIRLDREQCIDFDRSSHLEWLETNGTGGFAMGTVSGANTRRYHGLLVASLRPPAERFVLLAKLDETVSIDGADLALGTNQYPGTIHPTGFRHLVGFRLDPFPTWTFEVGGVRLEKTVFLVQGEQTAVIQYRSTQSCALRVQPFLAFRDYHSLVKANASFNTNFRESQQPGARVLSIQPYPSLPELYLSYTEGSRPFEPNGAWHYNTEYLEELDRGLDFREDLYRIGTLHLQLAPDSPAWIVASLERERRIDGDAVKQLERSELIRRTVASAKTSIESRLLAAADQFIVKRADGHPTVIAGYPWFTDWGRDTMIALPGLMLTRGLLAEAREVIRGFLQHINQGLIPNRFPDQGEQPEYNTVDATLWMFQAVHSYLQAGGDRRFLAEEFYPAARAIVRWHWKGTHHGIAIDERDGLLIAGGEGTQLTWMDAKVEGRVVTPRHGKPVEVNALYYNALRLMAQWARSLEAPQDAAKYELEAATVKDSFEAKFWNEERQCLYDVLTPTGPDPRLRPNQLFAVSLPFQLLAPARRVAVVRAVEAALLTPVGLRTLARGDPGYVPHYGGGAVERDGAYHQGVVWPWLLGPFIRAYLRVFGNSVTNVGYCRGLLRGLEKHLEEACLGTVSEIFEPEAPHRPVGAPAQAWSVAELLQVLRVDLAPHQIRPEFVPTRRAARGFLGAPR